MNNLKNNLYDDLGQKNSTEIPEIWSGDRDDINTDVKNRQSAAELDFQYNDCDSHNAELAELYSYSELEDFALNFEAYCQYMHERTLNNKIWFLLDQKEKTNIAQDLMERLENADAIIRLNAARILLYILQGSFYDFAEESEELLQSDKINIENNDESNIEKKFSKNFFQKFLYTKNDEKTQSNDNINSSNISNNDFFFQRGTGNYEKNCLINGALNAYFLYASNLYQSLCTMLAVERQESSKKNLAKQQSVSSLNSSANGNLNNAFVTPLGNVTARRSATLADNESLRIVINALYHMIEGIRRVELIPKIVDFSVEMKKKFEQNFENINITMYSVDRLTNLRKNFITELEAIIDSPKTPLVILLFDMMSDFVKGKCSFYPIKKMLLLTWKILLTTLGDMKYLRKEKARKRFLAGLAPIEDTIEVASTLKAVNYGTEFNKDAFISKLSREKKGKIMSLECGKTRFLNRQIACISFNNRIEKEDSTKLEDEDNKDVAIEVSASNEDEKTTNNNIKNNETIKNPLQYSEAKDDANVINTNQSEKSPNDCNTNSELKSKDALLKKRLDALTLKKPKGTPFIKRYNLTNIKSNSTDSTNSGDQTPRAGSPMNKSDDVILRFQTLPWKTKVKENDLNMFLQKQRLKYFGYQLPNDTTTWFGFSTPVLQSIAAFKRNVYISLGELQIKAENDYNRYHFSKTEVVEDTTTERLYQKMLPNLTEYVITLLKVILASLPSSKTKSDALTILSDVLTPETDTNEMLSNSISLDVSGQNVLEEAVRFAIDINRHKELIVKASSAILITLLKFFRLNHIYQFENFAQYLVLANCLPLVLKFIDQNILRYMQSKHELSPLNYPQCALYYVRNGGNFPILDADNVYEVDTESSSYYLWRNVFSSINLLRVLNKLTKWKHARTMMLVVFKSAPVLKRCMRVRLGIFQLYVLKLLKMQSRFLGRQWRKSNMDIISSIYMKVRHRLNDDWAFANETRSKSWDFQAEEAELGVAVKRFNCRRYKRLGEANVTSGTEDKTTAIAEIKNNEQNSLFMQKNLVLNNYQNEKEQNIINEVLNEDDWKFAKNDANSLETNNLSFDMTEFEPVDNCLQSVLSCKLKFSERFTQNYSKWLEEEVIKKQIDWDLLLKNTQGIAFK